MEFSKDKVLIGIADDEQSAVFMFYSYLNKRLIVVLARRDPETGALYEDENAHYENDSRARAEDETIRLSRANGITLVEEYEVDELDSIVEIGAWATPDRPYLN